MDKSNCSVLGPKLFFPCNVTRAKLILTAGHMLKG